MTKPDLQLSTLYRSFRITISISLAIVFLISVINLAGWIFNISLLVSLKPPWQLMKPITASCFIISAFSLVIIQIQVPAHLKKALSFFFTSFICIISVISLYVYFYSLETGHESPITQLSTLSFFLSSERLMAFLTACNFLFIGCIMFLLSLENKKYSNLAHVITVPVFLVSYFIIVSYILEVYTATELKQVPVSIYTGIAFFGLGASVLLMRPETWLLRLLVSRNTAGIISRKLLPPLLILPVIIGWLRIHGERTGMFKSEEGVVLVAMAYTFCFLIIIWLTARSIDRIDRKRRSMEEALRESEDKLRLVLNATQESIYMFDHEGRFTLANTTGFKRLEKTNEEDLIGHHLSEFMAAELAHERQAKIDEVFRTAELIEFEDVRDGIMFHHSFFPVLRNNEVYRVVSYSSDISARIKAEQKVVEHTKELEFLNTQLLKELTERIQIQEALKKSQTQLLELNATKDKFFNILAHDLKNPFTSLLGSSELLIDNVRHLDTLSIHELAQILNESAKSGYAILQNLLDWSRSQTGLLKINPERANLRILIDENISTLQLAAANKGIKIYNEVKEDLFVFADKNMINTIVRNLLSNAVKFTYKSGKVIVTNTLKTDEVIVAVKDWGIGIPEDKLEKLFSIETNYSMPGTENEQGTGLGLKLSKEFAEKLGGRIWVESIAGKGSEFMFSIPQILTT